MAEHEALKARTIPWRQMWRHPRVWRPALRFVVGVAALRVRRFVGLPTGRDVTSEWTYSTTTWRQRK